MREEQREARGEIKLWVSAQCFCPCGLEVVMAAMFLWAVWACPCLRPLVFLPQAPCEGNSVCCEGKPWPASARRLHRMKWAQTKQGEGDEEEEERCQTTAEEVFRLTCITATLFPPSCRVIWVRVTGCTTYIHDRTHTHTCRWNWEHSGVVGGKDGMWNLPSCSAKLCFRGRWKSHYVTSCLTWPRKLRNSFVELGSDLNELQSDFGPISRQWVIHVLIQSCASALTQGLPNITFSGVFSSSNKANESAHRKSFISEFIYLYLGRITSLQKDTKPACWQKWAPYHRAYL